MDLKMFCAKIGSCGIESFVRATCEEEAVAKMKSEFKICFDEELNITDCHEIAEN